MATAHMISFFPSRIDQSSVVSIESSHEHEHTPLVNYYKLMYTEPLPQRYCLLSCVSLRQAGSTNSGIRNGLPTININYYDSKKCLYDLEAS